MKAVIEFHCPACQCCTPAIAEFPDNMADRMLTVATVDCFHCGMPLEKTVSIGELRALVGQQKEWS